MKNWDSKKLYEIENQYRKLVLPFIKSDKGIFVRPPIVRIKFGYDKEKGHENISTLFNYHNTDDCFEVTKTLDEATSEKRYIVTNLQINPIDQNGFDYYIDYSKSNSNNEYLSYRRGFTVNLTLAETTKNFLDTVPNYYNYSKAVENTFSTTSALDFKNPALSGSDRPRIQDIFKLNYFEFLKAEANTDILNAFTNTPNTSADTNALKILKDKEIIKENFGNEKNSFIVKIYDDYNKK